MEDVPAWVIFSENPEGLIAEIELQVFLRLMETHLYDGKIMSCQIHVFHVIETTSIPLWSLNNSHGK